jgi:L-ascorbate metabolism protein UlaG (beta-lactamase superfamily)
MKKTCLIVINLLIYSCIFAQNQGSVNSVKTDWWGDLDGFVNQQNSVTLQTVDVALRQNPPAPAESLQRKMALLMIDNVLHEEKAAQRPSVIEFLTRRIENAVNEIQTIKVKKGAVIWKLYNHCFIVKTPSVTIGFDIQRGFRDNDEPVLKKELMEELIESIDILFISHFHGDHTDSWLTEMFLAQNKPVVSPPGIFPAMPFYSKILHPERKAHEIQEVHLPAKGITLQIVVYPGHQGETILNNVYLVFTPEGMSFAQTGDQSNDADFEWIDKIWDFHQTDVVMPNCWTTDPVRLAQGFRPRLIIPGHENEMGHTIDHREPFWLNYVRWGACSYPWMQMAWGEKFTYLPAKGKIQ